MEDNNKYTEKLIEDNTTTEETPFVCAEEEKDEGVSGHVIFLTGFLSGILLVLLLIGIFLMLLQSNLKKRIEQRSAEAVQEEIADTEETEELLHLDIVTVAEKIRAIEECINEYSIYQAPEEVVEERIYDGMLSALDDPYSAYLTVKEKEKLQESNQGEYVGIGAVLSQDVETLEVIVKSCYEDSPAMEGGLQSGDKLLKINDLELDGLQIEEITSYIKNGEEDSLNFTIQREEEELELVIRRDNVELPTVYSEMLEDHVGYMIISEFDMVTVSQFTQALQELEEEQMERLIIDLRNNPGGILQVVVDILDEILPGGMIVYTEDKYGNRQEFTSDEEHQLKLPLVVLINGNSASASEIFAGAIKDYGIGTLVGEQSFGKGIVQHQIGLSDGTGLKLTIAKYFTPNGNDIHEIGIEPDVPIELDYGDAEYYSYEVDNQLQKAIEVVKNKS